MDDLGGIRRHLEVLRGTWDTSGGIWGDLEASGWSWQKKCHTSQLKSKNPKNTSISRGVFEGHIDFDRIFTAT